jgi:hypothetical protein
MPIPHVAALDERKLAALKAFVFRLIPGVEFTFLVAYCLTGAILLALGSRRLLGLSRYRSLLKDRE